MAITTRLGKIVAHLDGLLPIKAHDLLITWSCDITWQAKTIISSLSQHTTKIGRMVTYLEGHTMLQSRGFAKSFDKRKSLYVYYQSTYGYQTWQNGDILWEASNHKVILRFDHVLFQSHVIEKSLYIHNQSGYPYKIGRMLTYLDEFLPIKSHHPLITWSCKITWQTKTILSPLPQCLWPWNIVGWWLILKGA